MILNSISFGVEMSIERDCSGTCVVFIYYSDHFMLQTPLSVVVEFLIIGHFSKRAFSGVLLQLVILGTGAPTSAISCWIACFVHL